MKYEYPVALNNLAFAKQKLLQADEAYEIYQKVLKLDPKNKTAVRQIEKINRTKKSNSETITYKKGF